MSLIDDLLENNLIKQIKKPVGNNKENEIDDVIEVKKKFAADGRYDKPIENGYIERELDTAINRFQEDYDLKQDGFMNPKGETETKLDEVINEKPVQVAGASAVPAMALKLVPLLGVTAMTAWQHYNGQSPAKRKTTRDELDKHKRECEANYAKETRECVHITNTKGSKAVAVCHSTAAERLAACQKGTPEDQWPPLFN